MPGSLVVSNATCLDGDRVCVRILTANDYQARCTAKSGIKPTAPSNFVGHNALSEFFDPTAQWIQGGGVILFYMLLWARPY